MSTLEMSDLDQVHQLHMLPETDEFNTLGIPENQDQTQQIIDPWVEANSNPGGNRTFKIEQLSDNAFVGLIGLNRGRPKFRSAEVWFKLHPEYWNKGYATEALGVIMKYGFEELGLHRIEAGCAISNTASERVLLKAGMLKEGIKRKVLPLKSGWSDALIFAMLRTDTRDNFI